MIWYRPTLFFSLSVRILVAPGFCLPEIQSFTILSTCCKNNSHTFFILRRDTHWLAVFSRWCCRNLGKKLQHNFQLQSSKQGKIRCTKAISNRHDYNYPCRQCYDLNSHKNIFGAIWHFSTGRSIQRCKIKTSGRNFKLRNMRTFRIKANCCRRKMKTAT